MTAPSPRVRIRMVAGLLAALATVLVPTPHPASASGSYGTVLVTGAQWAGQYASLGNLNVYDNGTGAEDVSGPYGLQYECVELIQRWAAFRWHEQHIWPIGRASEMWNAAPGLSVPLQQIPNGSAPPQFGDIIIFDATSYDPSGHTAIVADTGPGYVDLVEQNWNHIGFNRVSMSNASTMPLRWGLNPLGWLRGPGGPGVPSVISGNNVDASRKAALVAGDGSVWTSTANSTTPFRSLGGRVAGSAAVVQYPGASGDDRGTPLYLATGTDRQLYVRTDSQFWTPVSPYSQCINGPAGSIAPGPSGALLLTVGCEGADHALWTLTGTVKRDSLPAWQGTWTSLGGYLVGAPAFGTVNGAPIAGVIGSDSHPYVHPLSGGWWYPVTALSCTGQPALSAWNNLTFFACHSTTDALVYATAQNGVWSNGTWGGGVILDGPGLASRANGSATVDVIGSDRQVWEASLTADGAGAFSPQGWVVASSPGFTAMPRPLITRATENPVATQLTVNSTLSGSSTLGGTLDGAPAVVSAAGGTAVAPRHALYVGTFTDHTLRVRSDTAGWQNLSPAGPSCTDNPGAVVVGTTLTVACEGTDHQLWYASGTVPSSGLPSLTGWAAIFGYLTAGPAVVSLNGTVTFLGVGSDAGLYSATATQGFTRFGTWFCQGHPAAASAGATAYLACNGQDGQLWYAMASGAGWGAATAGGGRLLDGPGIAAVPGAGVVSVEGTDGTVWESAITAGSPNSAWSRVPLTATRGAAATAL